MRQRAINLCTPSRGVVSIHWAGCLANLFWPMNTGRNTLLNVDRSKPAKKGVAELRNEIVARSLFLDDGTYQITHLFWLDDDVFINPKTLLTLLRHDRDLASGVYFSKGENSEPLIFPGFGCGTAPFVPDALVESWASGMGLTLIKTEVYRRLLAEIALGTDACGNPRWYHTDEGLGSKTSPGGRQEVIQTEDLYFFEKASQLGYQVLVDCSRSCFGWHHDLNTNRTYPEKQYQQARLGEAVLWPTKEGSKSWVD